MKKRCFTGAAKEYPDDCEKTRKDIDRRLSKAIREWKVG